jgi:serine/threonine protein kinase
MSFPCPSCGSPVRDEARFCPRCGYHLSPRLDPGTELDGGDYRIVRSISKGGMGAVYLAEDRRAFDRACVVKQMLDYYDPGDEDERQRAQERFEEEGRTLARLSHPGIPKIYAFFFEGGRYYIVMEYIRGENLETYVTHTDPAGQLSRGMRLPQEEIVRYTIQACRILEYLHGQPRPVVHQDIKPANLILESQLGEVRLVDFGTARAEIPPGAKPGNGPHASVYGTDGYAPPEQYRGRPVPRSDVFALAATMYHLLTDDDPREHPFKWPRLSVLPRELGLALQRALRHNPEQRCSAEDLRHGLEAMSTPERTLQAFTFPGGARIRSVTTLPALCDEHWDAGRSFLYNGDFQRWLRDINRHDLVLAADDLVKHEENHDAGLEAFLRVIDPGLTHPKIAADQPAIDLGPIARESALIRRLTVVNNTRGYTQATVRSSQPWLEVYPQTLHCWAKIAADVRVNVRAENLPFRSQQRGTVTISSDGQNPLEIPVTARVSLLRETWRLTRRALSSAFPESWRMTRDSWRLMAQGTRAVDRFFSRHGWVMWLLWLVMGAAIGLGLYAWPADLSVQVGEQLLTAPQSWLDFLAPVALGPPIILLGLWLLLLALSLASGAISGFLYGLYKSFVR